MKQYTNKEVLKRIDEAEQNYDNVQHIKGPNNMSHTARLIKRQREKQKLSQGQLAKLLEVSAQFISNVENDRCPFPEDHIFGMATVLNVKPRVLVGALVADYYERLIVVVDTQMPAVLPGKKHKKSARLPRNKARKA